MGRQHQGMDRPGVRQVPEGSGEQGKMEKTGCKIICGAPMTLVVKGLMMMIMNANLGNKSFVAEKLATLIYLLSLINCFYSITHVLKLVSEAKL